MLGIGKDAAHHLKYTNVETVCVRWRLPTHLYHQRDLLPLCLIYKEEYCSEWTVSDNWSQQTCLNLPPPHLSPHFLPLPYFSRSTKQNESVFPFPLSWCSCAPVPPRGAHIKPPLTIDLTQTHYGSRSSPKYDPDPTVITPIAMVKLTKRPPLAVQKGFHFVALWVSAG